MYLNHINVFILCYMLRVQEALIKAENLRISFKRFAIISEITFSLPLILKLFL